MTVNGGGNAFMSRSTRSDNEEESETVWEVSDRSVQSHARCYHSDPECQHIDLDRAREVPRERAEQRFGARECATCAGEVENPGGGTSEHLRALKAAAAANAERDDEQV